MFMVGAVPIFSAWMLNSFQVTIQDLVLPLLLNLGTAALVAALFAKQFAHEKMSGYLAATFMMLILGGSYEDHLSKFYGTLQSFNPIPGLGGLEGIVISAFYTLVLFFIARWLGTFANRLLMHPRWKHLDFGGGLTIAISLAFLLQLTPVVHTAITEWPQFFYRPTALAATSSATSKPDVYYIVPDRYTSQNVLSSQFGFDNSEFTSFLQKNGFSVNPDAHQNYPYTTMSIASTMNANYHTDMVEHFAGADSQTVEPYQDSIRYSAVIQQFKAQGYTFDQLGSWYEASNQAPLADHSYQPEGLLTVFGHTFTLNTFAKSQLTDSFFWRIIQSGLSLGNFKVLDYSTISEADATTYKLKTLKDLANQPAGGRFIFTHLLVPHDPYYFNADGSLNANPSNDNVGEPIKAKYVNQVQYINTQLEQIVNEINTNSNGQAVIIIQSDEGPYPAVLNQEQFDGDEVGSELATGNMLNWSVQDLKMKYGILAAYHIPQASAADLAQGSDSVNIFRTVFNTYFQTKLPYLTSCYYAYPNGRGQPFVYQDITKQLTGSANAACPANSDFGPAKAN